jgi:phage/plasmid-like protein (TIGR03299 family)
MSHELEVVDGVASYAGREPGWHQLGTVDPNLTYTQAMHKAHLLDWNVRAVPFTALLGDDHDATVPLGEYLTVSANENQIVVRDNPATGKTESLGVVGDRYHARQNEEALAVAEELENLGATVETAGSIRGGRQVFLSLLMDGGWSIDPSGSDDRLQGYLLLRTSHDGSLAMEAVSTWVRVVCANTLDMTLGKDTPRAYKVRHTATGAERLASAQQYLVRANAYGEALATLAAKLNQVPMSNAEFIDLATDLYPEPESKRGKTLWTDKIDLLGDLFSGGGDVEYTLGNVSGSAWAGANALTERIDWHRKARGGDGTSLAIAASGFTPNITAEKNELFHAVVGWATEKAPAVMAKA